MDEKDAWTLFFSTGLPQAYLMARELERRTAPPSRGETDHSALPWGEPAADGGPLAF